MICGAFKSWLLSGSNALWIILFEHFFEKLCYFDCGQSLCWFGHFARIQKFCFWNYFGIFIGFLKSSWVSKIFIFEFNPMYFFKEILFWHESTCVENMKISTFQRTLIHVKMIFIRRNISYRIRKWKFWILKSFTKIQSKSKNNLKNKLFETL